MDDEDGEGGAAKEVKKEPPACSKALTANKSEETIQRECQEEKKTYSQTVEGGGKQKTNTDTNENGQ